VETLVVAKLLPVILARVTVTEMTSALVTFNVGKTTVTSTQLVLTPRMTVVKTHWPFWGLSSSRLPDMVQRERAKAETLAVQ